MQCAQQLTAKTVFFFLDRAPRRQVGTLAGAMMARYAVGQNKGLDVITTALKQGANASASINELVLDVIANALKHSANVAATINDLVRTTSPADVIMLVDRLIVRRDAAINKLFAAAPSIESKPVKAWLTLALNNQAGSVVGENIEQHIVNFALYDGWNRRRFEFLTLQVLIKAERDGLLDAFFKSSKFYSWDNIPGACKMGILRCTLKKNPGNYTRIRGLLAEQLSLLDHLELMELDIASGYSYSCPSHEEITKKFISAAPAHVRQDFEALVMPFYDAHDQSLMDARINNETRQKLTDAIKSHVTLGKPLSLIRIGDCEAYAYSGNSEHVTESDVKLRETHWWGCELNPSLRARIQVQVREAIEQADYLGMPSIFRFIRDVSETTNSMTSTASLRGLVAAMSCIKPKIGSKIVEDRIHQVMFSLKSIRALAHDSLPVHIISSVKPKVVKKFGLRANAITVPTHNKTRSNDVFQAIGKPLPFVYDGIINEIRSSVKIGDLVLVGAGIIGKTFVHEAYKCGGIALDVGSMVDYWAGAKTRSVADLV